MWSLYGRWWLRRRALAAAACTALLVAAALWPARTRRQQVARAAYPRTPPHALAHLLADFTNHPKLHPNLGSWTLEDEGGNYTHWWYSVSYECGARCRGRATVSAGAAGDAGEVAPRHGPAAAHRVVLAHRACDHLPLLSWPAMCEEWEIESLITPLEGGGGGSQVRERWTTRCGLAGCPDGAEPLVDRATHRLQRLHDLLFEKEL